jgi:hypothetical protein
MPIDARLQSQSGAAVQNTQRKPTRNRRLAAASNALGWLGVVAFGGAGALWAWFGLSLPKHADAMAGRLYALAYRGSVVYMTRAERHVLIGLFGAALLAIVVAVLLRIAHEGRRYTK